MSLQAVFFDMGGTIETFSWTPELRIQQTSGLQQRLACAGIHLELTDLQLYELIRTGLNAYHRKSLQTMEELPSARVWSDYILAGYPVNQEKLAEISEDLAFYVETRFYHRAMRPEIPSVLESIRRMDLKIGLISNVNSRGQVPANLEAYGIRSYFDPVVMSSVYGRRKPDPAIFHYAARLARVPTSACLYVGDRITRDILGAQRAGFLGAVQILHDYDHQELDEGASPDAVITDMTELVEIIKDCMDEFPATSSGTSQPHPGIRALLFDAGDILYFRPERGRYLQEFLDASGLAGKSISDPAARNLRQQVFDGSISQNEYREAILRLYGVDDPECILRGKQAMNQDDNNIQFFPGVRDTLLALKKNGYLLGIITDTANPLHVKLTWFENGGFAHVWDSIISSQEVGIQKPQPGIYQVALQQLGISASQAIFIGHDTDELDGALSVGLKTIAFNAGEEIHADFHIHKFSDLLEIPLLTGHLLSMTERVKSD